MFLNLAILFLGGWTYADLIADPPAVPAKPLLRAVGAEGGGAALSAPPSTPAPSTERTPTAAPGPVEPVNSLKDPTRVVRSFREGIPPDSITGRRLAEIEQAWDDR